LNRVYASEKDRVYAIERAEELEATLGSNPCCIKPMLQSHVTGGFWLVSAFIAHTPQVFSKPQSSACSIFVLIVLMAYARYD